MGTLEYRTLVVQKHKQAWEDSRERWYSANCYYEQADLVDSLRKIMEYNYQMFERSSQELQKHLESPYECICAYIIGGYYNYGHGYHICGTINNNT